MELQNEYVEIAGKQPSRGHTPLGAVLLLGVVLISGAFIVFGRGMLQSHFLSQEMEQSKKTVVIDYEENVFADPVFEDDSLSNR
jgi:hypothetical protein